MEIKDIQAILDSGTLNYGLHAIMRMEERGISKGDIEDTIRFGEIIEEYPNQKPYPRCLILRSLFRGRPLHIVLGVNLEGRSLYLVTAYEPDIRRWEPGFKKRKEQKE